MVTLVASAPAPAAAAAPSVGERLPQGVRRQTDGTLADAAGAALYTFNYDTMVGMSHCEDDCARMWPPLAAPKSAKAFGDWSVIPRPDRSAQWAYKTKPLYTYSEDRPGQPARGLEAPNWSRAK
jgi:predicted lipoprotein with Yx(FWY)xxD motif